MPKPGTDDHEHHDLSEDLSYIDDLLGLPAPSPPGSRISAERIQEIYAQALLHATPALTRRRRIRRRMVWSFGVAAVTAAAIGLFVVDLPHPRPAYAATPAPLPIAATPPGATPLTLAALAHVAGTGTDAAAGGVDHLITDRWDLNSSVNSGNVASAVVPSQRELWRAGDDRGRTIDTYLEPQFPTGADRDNWDDASYPQGPQRNDYGKGELPAAFRGRPPRDPGELAAWLMKNAPRNGTILDRVTDLLEERALTGSERRALLEVLATRTGLAYAGSSTDRAGRSGAAFTASATSSGGHITYVFLIDPRTARLLATEEILTGGAPALNVKRPAVISYRTYQRAEHVTVIP
ncbi:CU044_5270 family protein [Actinoplanes sichuanensis]|uniref:CU044_5270 family protein n=1 Tax=Actinoplanes sichuanensis TaxID=512349 RepID=A0ABW4A1X4_9ACTN